MSKIKFVHHPRSIIRKRQDYPSSLFATIPMGIIQATRWKPSGVLEFVAMTEGTEWQERYVKVRKVSD